jgi:hypothetical protein
MRLASRELVSSRGSVNPEIKRRAVERSKDLPLAKEPFLLAALDAIQAGRTAQGEQLLREAHRRDPRSRLTLLLLLDRNIRAGRSDQVLAQMKVLMRLIPQSEAVLSPELAKFAMSEKTRPQLKKVLAKDPDIEAKVLHHLASQGTSPDVLMDLASPVALRNAPGSNTEWQSRLLTTLIERGNVSRAHETWMKLSRIDGRSDGPIYDASFAGLPGPPPFNWSFAQANAGVATPIKGRGLDVDYYGRDPGDLASQLLVLEPGRYRLSLRAEGDLSGEGSQLLWKIACREDGRTLLELPLRGGGGAEPLSGTFGVPAGCRSAWITLIGRPSEFAKRQTAAITDLKLQRAD